MMTKEQIGTLVTSATQEYLDAMDKLYMVKPKTQLFGPQSPLDSIGLVNIIIDIESKLLDQHFEVSLVSEKAMSSKNSPFRTVETLVEFIDRLLQEGADGEDQHIRYPEK